MSVFAALGDPVRLHVVSSLSSAGPMSITRLTEGSGVTRQAVTKHLAILSGAGLVVDFRSGRERLWELEPGGLDDARRALDRISGQWGEALERLARLVEE